MKKTFLLFYSLTSLFCVLSCSNSIDEEESQIEVPANDFSLISSKTQASLETILQFSFQGSLPVGVSNINWDFGDGDTYYGNSDATYVNHAFRSSGNYTVKAKILYGNGKSVEKSISVIVVANNQIKLTKITITKVPQTIKQFSVMQYGSWVYYNFSGEWDQTENQYTSSIDRFADIYLELYKTSNIVDPNNPQNILKDYKQQTYKSGIHLNQQSLIYSLSSENLIFNLESLKNLTIIFKDSDLAYSMAENGKSDQEMSNNDILSTSFQTNNQMFSINYNGLIYTIEYQKL